MAKRIAEETHKSKRSKVGRSAEELKEIEERILNSPKYYNELVTLIEELDGASSKTTYTLATAILSIFGKLIKEDALRKSKKTGEAQSKVVDWLRGRYDEYKSYLFAYLKTSKNESVSIAIVEIIMRLLKLESKYFAPTKEEFYFPKELFDDLLVSLLESKGEVESVLEHLANEYFEQYDDLRYFFYHEIAALAPEASSPALMSDRLIDVLIALTNFPESDEQIDTLFFSTHQKSSKSQSPLKVASHRAIFQKGWIAALRLPQTEDSYKAVMIVLHKRIIPNMNKPQLLLDFLTDAYNSGGSIALLALNGLFSLMQKYNLDYPQFFTKLYALFDESIMHVKYRSRFFRLVDLFLSSTHLPVNVLASFIKRMARLSLTAPPGAIITIVPFIYNQLRRHPTCMKMIHNPDVDSSYTDPFDNEEADPALTNAVSSSLWEIESLQSHYHPNVAAIARIMSQPFRKPEYPLEDFLDYTYDQLLTAEFGKRLREETSALEHEDMFMFEPEEEQTGEQKRVLLERLVLI